MDIKNNIPISQIENEATTLGNNDLLLISAKNNDGTYTSKKIKFNDLKNQISTSGQTIEEGTVGVIDGTLMKSPPLVVSENNNGDLHGVSSYTYIVENDCYLVIRLFQTTTSTDIQIKVNNQLVHQEYYIDTSSDEPVSFSVPVKKYSEVKVQLSSIFSVNSTLTFYEYKLFATNPQIGFPDYDNIQTVNLPSEWTGGDLQFIAPSDGYVSLYIISQSVDNDQYPKWKLLVNNEIVCYQDSNYGGQETLHASMLPVRKNDTIKITYYDDGEYGNITSDSFFNFYPVSAVGDVIVKDLHCGVIDGTYYRKETIDKEITTGDIYQLYTVQNDCGLYLEGSEYSPKSIRPAGGGDAVQRYAAEDKEIHYFLDSEGTLPFYKHTESGQTYEWSGCTTFVKKGTIVYCKIPTGYNDTNNVYTDNAATTYNIRFNIIEYKLTSLNPQIAFPDWDISKKIDINPTPTLGNEWTAPDNGYIRFFAQSYRTNETPGDTYVTMVINEISVSYSVGNSAYNPIGINVVPVSKGDKIYFTNVGGISDQRTEFYPAKTDELQNKVIKEHGGCGVIDGTVLTSDTFSGDIYTNSTTLIYTVKNDCGLCIREENMDKASSYAYYLDSECTKPLWAHDETRATTSESWGTIINLKKNSKIYVICENNGDATATIPYSATFYEYKLSSIEPQIAFPDYNKAYTLHNHTSTSEYTIQENGFIKCIAVENDATVNDIKINNCYVGKTFWATINTNYEDTNLIPVSKGDILSFSVPTSVNCTFIPLKQEYKEIEVVNNFGGGVTDGTILNDTGIQSKTAKIGNFTEVYTVQNDCLLYIWAKSSSDDRTIRLFFKQDDSSPIAVFGETMSSGAAENSRTIPVKKDTKIYSDIYNDANKQFDIRFIEYKIVSTLPQAAFPDWDISKRSFYYSQTTINENGYLVFPAVAVYNTYHFYVALNNKDNVVWSIGVGGNEHIRDSTIIPVTKGDIVYIGYNDSGTGSITWLDNSYKDLTLNSNVVGHWYFYPVKSVEQNGSQTIVSGGSGGVIDGTILHGPIDKNNQEITISGNTITYTIKNDCWLVIYYYGDLPGSNSGVEIQLNNKLVGVFEEIDSDSVYSYNAPVKKNSVIKIQSNQGNFNVNSLVITEYKLNSIAPQIALPDYGAVPETVTDNWIAQKNGWLLCNYDSGQSDSEDSQVKIDNVIVYKSRHGSSGYDVQSQPALIPISKGSTVNIVVSSGSISVKFYPCKSQLQPDCVSYVIESKRFCASDGTTHEIASENDSWYRLYNDGFCEQGGVFTMPADSSDKSLVLGKSYGNTNYVITLGNRVSNGYIVNITDINARGFIPHSGTDGRTGSGPEGIDWKTEGYIE